MMLQKLGKVVIVLSTLLVCVPLPEAIAAEAAVLLNSTAPGYTPGMVVAPHERLLLPNGASVTLLFRSGQMLKLRGPLDASLDQATPAQRQVSAAELAKAFHLHGVDASVIGGSRAIAAADRRLSTDDVLVNVVHSGVYCVFTTQNVWLTRPMAELPGLALRRRGNIRTIAWPAGTDRIGWPLDVPIEDGDRFEILADAVVQATLTFRIIDTAARAEAATIAEAVLLGCRDQFGPALSRLANAVMPPELWLGSDRGLDPVYRSKERIGLTVMASADGWLYCVLIRSDGTAIPIFPAGAIDGAKLPGAIPVAIPGHRRSVALLAGPGGMERVR
ncbi:MAG: DUF4384 domain-containing protein, partial [Solirubrobacterales bacterium]|nr:DUF4384 domain-containing protein [Solirubrobacterales bacterium]